MAASATLYGPLTAEVMGAYATQVDWIDDLIRVALVDDSYTPDVDLHQFFSDITGELVSDNYIAGGQEILDRIVTYNSDSTSALHGSDTSWTGLTGNVRYAIVYKDSGSPATSPLIMLVDLTGSEEVLTNTTVTLTWNVSGVLGTATDTA